MDLSSIIRDSAFTATGVCHTIYVDCLLAVNINSVAYQNKFEKLCILLSSITPIHHDSRSSESIKKKHFFMYDAGPFRFWTITQIKEQFLIYYYFTYKNYLLC